MRTVHDSVASYSPSLLHGSLLVSSHTYTSIFFAPCSLTACGGAGDPFSSRSTDHPLPHLRPSHEHSAFTSDPPPPRVIYCTLPSLFSRSLPITLDRKRGKFILEYCICTFIFSLPIETSSQM
ncbi:hypothetical protein PHLGIDRAFT_395721 [Phlebiopsis gigantea 11061_1 CR5-6]|uniref:Uncharacterized protein n=1 Tax=Phlebiopsis gigantea (strain 11061_1 CR5-6) TaxID=745531 RepID=A0A0C3SFE4_PHLG1|nr:hypothetical protein PHLGIDRAFT_395721 [Phlebiopsis gigantea 11061_1 CR5-6]